VLKESLPRLRRLELTFLNDYWSGTFEDPVTWAGEVPLMRPLAEITQVKVVPVDAESDRHGAWQLKAYDGSESIALCMEAWDKALANAKQVDEALNEDECDAGVGDEVEE